MSDRYESMNNLLNHLNQLFKLCGVGITKVALSSLPRRSNLIEILTGDNAICSYLDKLDEQTQQAISSMKERQLIDWNNKENEKRFEEQENELEQQYQQIVQLEEDLSEQRKTADRLRREQLNLIYNLIAMRDNLWSQLNYSESCSPQMDEICDLLQGQLNQTARVLQSVGVEILDEGGLFDHCLHTVIETRPAVSPEQIDQIAETFRPGYAFQGEILRSQEIILFSK